MADVSRRFLAVYPYSAIMQQGKILVEKHLAILDVRVKILSW